jgi:hypothetical protein
MDKLTRGLVALEDENEILRTKNAQLEKDVRLDFEGCVLLSLTVPLCLQVVALRSANTLPF